MQLVTSHQASITPHITLLLYDYVGPWLYDLVIEINVLSFCLSPLFCLIVILV